MRTRSILAALATLFLLFSAGASFADNECDGSPPPGFNCFGKN